jgi:spermidine/putrescine transport system ATP-binding protein
MSDRIAVMRGGRFEQTGSAADVYERPETSFVARFVGEANIIEGTVVSGEKGVLVFEHPAGRGRAVFGTEKPPPGGWVTVAVRGEHIELSPAGHGDAEGLRAIVSDRSFAGGRLRVGARLQAEGGAPGGDEIHAYRRGIDSPLSPGDAVRIHWKAEHAVVVRGDEAENAASESKA